MHERSQGGLGVGLTIARSIAALHGGRIRALSRGRGAGSEFIVELPVASDRAQEGSSRNVPLDSPRCDSGRRILIVDDNRDSAESLGMLLRLVGHEVLTAFDSRSALEAVHKYAPEVVLLDIGLPEMNGYLVARRIRELGSMACVVAVTGFGQPEDVQRSREAGFDHHLVKPVEPADLLRILSLPSRSH